MATKAQCAYCFETIAARLEGRKQLSLAQIEELWEIYENGEEDEASAQLKAEAHQAGVAEDDDMEDAAPAATTTEQKTSPYRPAAISRLLNPSPASSSSTSSASPSAASSTPSLNSNASKASSRSSLFSLSRRFSRGRKTSSNTGLEEDVEEYPLFVTWNKVDSHGQKRLAGCIGTFEPYELEEGLNIYSRTAAFEDDRFDHIRLRDLPILSCSITLLMHFEPIADPMNWVIGTHGLRIAFTSQGRRLGATYLPDVAREQGWTKEETIVSLMRKAGWSGRSSEWRGVRDLSCIRYQGMKASLGYREWREWRDWVEETGREVSELET